MQTLWVTHWTAQNNFSTATRSYKRHLARAKPDYTVALNKPGYAFERQSKRRARPGVQQALVLDPATNNGQTTQTA